jgi:hypothetical protein
MLAMRVRLYSQTTPSKLYYWIIGSLVVFIYKVILGTLVVFYTGIAEVVEWYENRATGHYAIFMVFHYNLIEILPFIIFKTAIKVSTTQSVSHTTHPVSTLEEIYDIFSIRRDNLLIEESSAEGINSV